VNAIPVLAAPFALRATGQESRTPPFGSG